MIKDGNFAGLPVHSKTSASSRSSCARRSTTRTSASLSDGKQVRKLIADHGLTCESAHFGMDELRKRQSESIAWAHDVGITQMVTATLGAGDKPDAG